VKIAIDLHIHSALSPCSDDDMTPNNIVNMAVLNGLDAIAITDHNSCDNVESVMKAAEGRIIVIPGMELQTIEEVHLLSYFTDLYSLLAFSEDLEQYYDGSPNRPEFFGHQLIMDEKDEIIGEKKQALIPFYLISICISFLQYSVCATIHVLSHYLALQETHGILFSLIHFHVTS
jgi:PHP family Zn ribbon phosphoesterase